MQSITVNKTKNKSYPESVTPLPRESLRVVEGRLTLQAWMQGAVGAAISIEPMLKAVDESLKVIK